MAVTMLYAGERDYTLTSKRYKLISKTVIFVFSNKAGNRFALLGDDKDLTTTSGFYIVT